jgi:hypothetical protein
MTTQTRRDQRDHLSQMLIKAREAEEISHAENLSTASRSFIERAISSSPERLAYRTVNGFLARGCIAGF